jgi:hypothetical protein
MHEAVRPDGLVTVSVYVRDDPGVTCAPPLTATPPKSLRYAALARSEPHESDALSHELMTVG